jgi:MraZ protein
MSLLFAGKELRKFDQVNRMSIPPGYRKDLGETVYMMKSIYKEPCLMIFSEEEWEIFSMGFISAFSGEKQAKAQRKLADRVEKLTVDKSGRISIKDDFKAYAALEDEVLVVGTMNRVELWTPENWEAWNVDDDDDDFDFSNVSLSAPRV